MSEISTISKPKIGRGIFTISDASRILGLSQGNVRRWVSEYWDAKFGLGEQNLRYSWDHGFGRAIDFYTLIEVYVFAELRNAGVKIKDINRAHQELSIEFDTPFPFSNKNVISGLNTDGRTIFFSFNRKNFVSLDGTRQFNLDLITEFFKKVDFNGGAIVSKFYPLGKRKNVVVDPTVKFGQPTVVNTGVAAETLYDLYLSGEKIKMIAFLYNLDTKSVNDAIKFCKTEA